MNRRSKTWWWRIAAVTATTYLVAMYLTGALPRSRQLIVFDAHGVLEVEPTAVQRVKLSVEDHDFGFKRDGASWVREHDGVRLPSKQATSLERAVKFMHTSAPVRSFIKSELQEAGISQYGLNPPQFSISLFSNDKALLRARFGDMNASGFLQYMRVKGRDELFLISRFVGAEWEVVAAVSGQEENHHHGRLPIQTKPR